MSIQERYRPRGGSFFSRGYNVEKIETLPEFLKARGLDYQVAKEQVSVPVFEQTQRPLETGIYGEEIERPQFVAVENQYVVRRQSDGAVVSPMTVSSKYGEISPLDMAEDLIPFVEQGLAVPDSAFLIQQGCVENVECVALRLNLKDSDPFQDGLGEVYRAYLVARNYHGRGAASASLFLEREISSSLMTAIAKVSGFKIVHRGQVRDKYALAMKRWAKLRELMQRLANRLGTLNDVPMSFREAENFVNDLLGVTMESDGQVYKDGKKAPAQTVNLRAAYMDAFNMPRFGTFGSTAADMYHGVTWVGSHYTPAKSKQTADSIMEGLLEGTRGNRERKALRLLDAFVANKLTK